MERVLLPYVPNLFLLGVYWDFRRNFRPKSWGDGTCWVASLSIVALQFKLSLVTRSFGIAALQFSLSRGIRSFALPLGIGLGAAIAGLEMYVGKRVMLYLHSLRTLDKEVLGKGSLSPD
ncbi:hypothetical protein [Paenibacillus sp. NPDC057934]|uniref:hypothetical protein n=1 Tax=Paenibacillus sp. NPDC057934 TaxID=3346282 RepID=UPI0036DB2C8D